MKIEKPKVGLNPDCEKLLDEIMNVELNSSLPLFKKRWLFHNLIQRAYTLGFNRGVDKCEEIKNV